MQTCSHNQKVHFLVESTSSGAWSKLASKRAFKKTVVTGLGNDFQHHGQFKSGCGPLMVLCRNPKFSLAPDQKIYYLLLSNQKQFSSPCQQYSMTGCYLCVRLHARGQRECLWPAGLIAILYSITQQEAPLNSVGHTSEQESASSL